MKNLLRATSSFLVLISVALLFAVSCGKSEGMREARKGSAERTEVQPEPLAQEKPKYEVEDRPHRLEEAPPEAVAAFRGFFAYVARVEPSIVEDEAAQSKWLSTGMRRDFTEHVQRSAPPHENPSYPSNATFTCVWNQPTTYKILGSRRYDFRDDENPGDNRAIIDVLYEWDRNTDGLRNQYPGEKSLYSFIFVSEEGSWRLDDIYTFDDQFASPESLRSYLSGTSR